ncbi:hypothetical protein A2U01_0029329 [Trifolium medium]|uniref:Uncharacterized protein n=1 Tax=Trifolium medium TaxID=97028 RepID=A0A392P836_9FABA|nr:hypothetical protein [Trifolium medium]
MDISQAPQYTTEGKFPHGKEPEPFKDEADKTQKVNRKKRKIPDWEDPNTHTHEDIPSGYWEQPFLHDYIHEPIEIELDEASFS